MNDLCDHDWEVVPDVSPGYVPRCTKCLRANVARLQEQRDLATARAERYEAALKRIAEEGARDGLGQPSATYLAQLAAAAVGIVFTTTTLARPPDSPLPFT